MDPKSDLPSFDYPKSVLKAGHDFFKKPCLFVLGASEEKHLKSVKEKPEFAFIGRSNVGKSSLINALVHQKGLARTSKTPGRTQQLNFFILNEKFYLVDLPGYGYAKASKASKYQWQSLIDFYFQNRRSLKLIILLIDGRHGLMKTDLEFMQILNQYGVPYQIVLTKIDKAKKAEYEGIRKSVQEQIAFHPAAFPYLIETSAEKKIGLDVLRARILEVMKNA